MKKMGLVILFFCAALLFFVCLLNAMDMMQKTIKVKRIEVFEYQPDSESGENEFVAANIKNQA